MDPIQELVIKMLGDITTPEVWNTLTEGQKKETIQHLLSALSDLWETNQMLKAAYNNLYHLSHCPSPN